MHARHKHLESVMCVCNAKKYLHLGNTNADTKQRHVPHIGTPNATAAEPNIRCQKMQFARILGADSDSTGIVRRLLVKKLCVVLCVSSSGHSHPPMLPQRKPKPPQRW